MANKNHNLESLFQEKLSGYEVKPSDKVWDSIQMNVKSTIPYKSNTWLVYSLLSVLAITLFLVLENKQYFAPQLKEMIEQKNHFPEQVNHLAKNFVKKQERPDDPMLDNNTKNKARANLLIQTEKNASSVEKEQVKGDTNTLSIPKGVTPVHTSVLTQQKKSKVKNSFVMSTTSGCAPLEVSLVALCAEKSTFLWSVDNVTNYTTQKASHTFIKPGKHIVSLVVKCSNELTEIYTDTIVVFENPVAEAEMDKSTNNSLSALYTYNYSQKAESYAWMVNDSIISLEREPVLFKNNIKGQVVLKVWSEKKCSDTTIVANILGTNTDFFIKFPNAFRPEISGTSGGRYSTQQKSKHIFHPVFEGVTKYSLEVYNRWGQLLFKTNDLYTGWDGYYNGRLAKQDAYIWKASGTYSSGKPFVKKGDVILLRK